MDEKFINFQDKFYNFLEQNGFTNVDCDHPKWNEICELRNKIFDLLNPNEDALYRVDTYNIRVRAEYVGYYKVKGVSLCDAEEKAKQLLFKEMNDQVDGSFDFEEYEDE